MKKVICILLLLITAMTLAVPSLAADIIGKGTPIIDGNFDDIYTVSLSYPRSPVYHSEIYGNFLPADIPAEIKDTMEAMIYMLWDPTHIYILIEVKDDDFMGTGDESLAYWAQGDGVIFMYYPGDTGGDNVLYRKLRIAYSAETFNASPASTDSEYPDQVEYKFLQTAKGYNLEVAITLGGGITLKENDVIEFATQVNDIGKDDSLGYAYVNESFAQITFPRTLGPEAVVVTEEEVAAPVESAVIDSTAPAAPVVAAKTVDYGIIVSLAALLGTALTINILKKKKYNDK